MTTDTTASTTDMIFKGSKEYDEARSTASWNARLPDRYPHVIAPAKDAADVIAAVRYARDRGLKVKARSGGHSWTASGIRDGSVMVDLSLMNNIRYVPGEMTAVVEPGVHGHELNTLLAPHNLFFPTGHCSTVALGGFLLQGGWGWNSRSVGPACLSVEAVDVVTADGEMIRADKDHNPDFWWAARGAGPGYFGIVTAFHVRLHNRPKVMRESSYVYPLALRTEVLRWAHEVGPTMPTELEFSLLATTPRQANGEIDEAGTALVVFGRALMADEEAARAALDILDTCPVLDQAVRSATHVPTTFEELYAQQDGVEEKGFRWCADNVWTDAGIEELLPSVEDMFVTVPTAVSHVLWYQWHPQEFPDAAISIQGNLYIAAYSGWTDSSQDEQMAAWPRDHMARLDPLSNGTALADENLVERPARFLSEENERRLEGLRSRHDPEGLFLSYLTVSDVEADTAAATS